MANLPHPNHIFTIPSLQGDADLPCRVYHPVHNPSTPSCAIIAHPYAPMGGSYDDPIVLNLVDELTHQGHIVGTFNFRGGPESKVGTSWTAKAETQDYISMVHFMTRYASDVAALRSEAEGSLSRPAKLSLLLGGYSYGAMVMALLPPLSSIYPLPEPKHAPTLSTIHTLASRLAYQSIEPHTSKPSLDQAQLPLSAIQPSYLFISPLLGPIANLATFFGASSAKSKGEEKLVARDADTLVIYGDRDTFTSAQRVRTWCEDMAWRRNRNNGRKIDGTEGKRGFEGREIGGAGHFWREAGVEDEMRGIVRAWLQRKSS